MAEYKENRISFDLKSRLTLKDGFHIVVYKCGIILTRNWLGRFLTKCLTSQLWQLMSC